MTRLTTLIISLAVMGLGAWPVYMEIRRVRALQEWPHKMAQITKSQLKNIGEASGLFHLRLDYQYTVEGKLYRGSGEIATGKRGTQKDADDLTRRYSVGCSLPIVYNPRRHKENLIIHDSLRQLDWFHLGRYLIIILVALASLVGLAVDALAH